MSQTLKSMMKLLIKTTYMLNNRLTSATGHQEGRRVTKLGSGSEGVTNPANVVAAPVVRTIGSAAQAMEIASEVWTVDRSAVSARGPPTRTERPHSPFGTLAKEPNLP